MYYFMGLVSTDGYIDTKNNRISIRLRNEGAKELLESLKDYFEFSGNLRVYRGKDYDLTITSNELISFLESNGIKGKNKTFEVKALNYFPNEDCVRMYLRGVLDGDGNIHLIIKDSKLKSGEFRLVTASNDFMTGIQSIFSKYLNIIVPIKTHNIKGSTYPLISLSMKDSRLFYRWVYKGFSNLRLKDKFEKAKMIVEDIV